MAFESPVYNIIAVPVEKVKPNDYNPNAVAPPELKLLYDSIKEDGYTMPIVCYYNEENDSYIIVDGFHRYRIMLEYPDIYAREHGKSLSRSSTSHLITEWPAPSAITVRAAHIRLTL